MTSHRAEAAGLMAKTAACPDASEHLLAAIHDLLAERLPMPLVTRNLIAMQDQVNATLDKLAALNPGGHVAGPTEVHEAGGCDECSCDRCTEPDPEPDVKSDPGPEPAPRALICTEAEAEAHREVRRLVSTTYQIEDDPSVLRGSDGADLTPSALAWLERFVEDADPDMHPAYTGKPERSESDTVTVTLPLGVVERARDRLLTAARWASEDEHPFSAQGHLQAARALSDAMDAANTTNPATGDDLSAPQPSEAPADGEGTW